MGVRLGFLRVSGRSAVGAPAVAAIALLAAAAAGAGAQEPAYRLQLSDEIGQVSRYRLAFDIEMRAKVTGAGEPDEAARRLIDALASGMKLSTVVEYERVLVDVAEDGVRTFEVRWRDYRYAGELGGAAVPPPPGFTESVRDLLSQTARVRTTPTGRTIAVAYSHPELASLARRLEQMEGGMPTYLPETPVRVGDRWASTATIPLGVDLPGRALTLALEHTLKAVRGGPDGAIAEIALSGSYSQLQGMEAAGGEPPLHVQASLTGSSLFDIGRGRFVGGRYEIDMFALHAADGVEIQLTGHATGDLELLSAR
jgi:hypothetical protein